EVVPIAPVAVPQRVDAKLNCVDAAVVEDHHLDADLLARGAVGHAVRRGQDPLRVDDRPAAGRVLKGAAVLVDPKTYVIRVRIRARLVTTDDRPRGRRDAHQTRNPREHGGKPDQYPPEPREPSSFHGLLSPVLRRCGRSPPEMQRPPSRVTDRPLI